MKTSNFLLPCALLVASLASCSSHDDAVNDLSPEKPGQPHTCELVLNITKKGYDGEQCTRSAAAWENGEKIYLLFTTGNSTTNGEAVYNDGKWTVSYYGALNSGIESTCVARYFENPGNDNGSLVYLSENSAIYEDQAGTYYFDDGTLSVTASLSPKTGRIRFAGGIDQEEITLYGISYYSSYDINTGNLITDKSTDYHISTIKTKVSDGYTPYIYGIFSNEDVPRISMITSADGYTCYPSTTSFQPGESGFMTIPTEASHNGWKKRVTFTVNKVDFDMIYLANGRSKYLMAETEMTERLYYAINGNSSNYVRPYTSSVSNHIEVIDRLNNLTGFTFKIPTDAEWLYAAKGGSKSEGFTYSGSNDINEVAWYSSNSGGNKHEVKQLKCNEAGFYDMSGNAAELVVKSGEYLTMGGYYNGSPSYCVLSAEPVSTGSSYMGLRLCMSL